MSGTSIFNGTTSCFRLGPFKSGMFWEVESNVMMTRCRLQGGDGEVGMATGRQESRERLPTWKILGAGRGCLVEEAGGEGNVDLPSLVINTRPSPRKPLTSLSAKTDHFHRVDKCYPGLSRVHW